MNKIIRLPKRSKVKTADTWDLSKLFSGDKEWDAALKKLDRKIKGYDKFRGQLATDAETLANCMKFDSDVSRLAERLGNYAYLRTTEDQSSSEYQGMLGRFQNVASRAGEASSFMRPEILSLSAAKLKKYLASPKLKKYRLLLERLVRYKPHTLSNAEEKLLAMQSEMAGATGKIFRQLTDADLKFGVVKDENNRQVELTQSTFSQLLQSPKRPVRRNAFEQFYDQFSAHENSLAATYNGSVQKDVYYARARGYDSALDAALFGDKVPISVYEQLIAAVRNNLPALYAYYDLRRRKMKLRDIHHYDTYVPILSEVKTRHTWAKATDTIVAALHPLGSDYCDVLCGGLHGRWCDRYPNEGKQSGAFSYGTYDGDPYILMNFKPDVLNDVFTLAHEAGHSMHSYLSSKHQSYEYHDYTIFVAEVASTFNEQLLTHHLLDKCKDDRQRAMLINNEIDSIRATIIRQTMFAEFEKLTHEMIEAGEPLTVAALKKTYRELLRVYFGPDFSIDDQLELECLRIPHFYRAFYVYKYATGLSAAIALSQRVLNGGSAERDQFLSFLKGGCSKYPLDLLRDAGVDLETPQPVDTALGRFNELVQKLDELL